MLVVGWTCYRSLVPAIHPDHDHGLENIAGGGFLWVEATDGKRRNLVPGACELPTLTEHA